MCKLALGRKGSLVDEKGHMKYAFEAAPCELGTSTKKEVDT